MFKRFCGGLLLLGFVACLQGCETAKGLSQGFSKDVKNTWENLTGAAGEGGSLQKADKWVQENMW